MNVEFKTIPRDSVPWDEMAEFADWTPFQSRAWLRFLEDTQRGKAVVARILIDGEPVGFFSGVAVRNLGLSILGSPFKGWGTPYIGFNLEPGVDRRRLIQPLARFAFDELHCHHLEFVDRELPVDEDAEPCGPGDASFDTIVLDLTRSEREIHAAMTKACRQCIRKAAGSGVTIEEAQPEGFAEEYYAQVLDVFDRHGAVPPFGISRVRALIRNMHPTGNLLLLRARGPDGRSIATGLSCGAGRFAYLWGAASLRQHQILRPNEALTWHSIRHWKNRGATQLDMGGMGKYKLKYGARVVRYHRHAVPRFKIIVPLRDMAERAWRLRCNLVQRLQLPRRPAPTTVPIAATVNGGYAPDHSSSRSEVAMPEQVKIPAEVSALMPHKQY